MQTQTRVSLEKKIKNSINSTTRSKPAEHTSCKIKIMLFFSFHCTNFCWKKVLQQNKYILRA